MTDLVAHALNILDRSDDEYVAAIQDLLISSGHLRFVAYAYGSGDSGQTEEIWLNKEDFFERDYRIEDLLEECRTWTLLTRWCSQDIGHPSFVLYEAVDNYLNHRTGINYNDEAEEGWLVFDLTKDPIGWYKLRWSEEVWNDGDTGYVS